MKKSFFILLLFFSLLGLGQEAHAQFGLFDTVWTTKNFAPTGYMFMTVSKNDSLIFLLKEGAYGVPNDTSEKFILFHTMDISDTIWSISNFPIQNLPIGFIENDSKILFDSKTIDSDYNYSNPCILTRDASTFQVVDSIFFDLESYPPQTQNCIKWYSGVSEIDTSVYYSGYCSATAIKGISYKVNYKTGETTITSDSLPYFKLTLSEDGQYVAGIYYQYNYKTWPESIEEVIEVRKISDYSLVLRDKHYYCDLNENFDASDRVKNFGFLFSKDNHYLVSGRDKLYIYDLITSQLIFAKAKQARQITFSNNNILFFLRAEIDTDQSEKIKASTFDCDNDIYLERDYPDSTNQLIFDSDELVFNNNFVLCHMLNKYDKSTNYYSGFAEVALLSLNFDLTSIQPKILESGGNLYPNPATEYITIDSPSIKRGLGSVLSEIVIYDVFGNKVLTTTPSLRDTPPKEGNYIINVTALPTGTYFLRAGSEVYKFMVVR